MWPRRSKGYNTKKSSVKTGKQKKADKRNR